MKRTLEERERLAYITGDNHLAAALGCMLDAHDEVREARSLVDLEPEGDEDMETPVTGHLVDVADDLESKACLAQHMADMLRSPATLQELFG